MKKVLQTRQFLRDVKRLTKRCKNLNKLKVIVTILAQEKAVDPRYRDHALTGNWNNSHDCHIEPDWILIYTVDAENLRLERTGTHSDLFR